MKDDTRKRLENALDSYKERDDAKTTAQQQREAERKAFIDGWAAAVKKIIEPALNEVTAVLESNGWVSAVKIEKTSRGGPGTVDFLAYRGDMRAAAGNSLRPTLSFHPDPVEKIVRVQRQGTAVALDKFPLDQVTSEMVQNSAAKFIEQLTSEP
jgi:hypothetical protein